MADLLHTPLDDYPGASRWNRPGHFPIRRMRMAFRLEPRLRH